MFASGVGRIFREFDEFLDLTYARRAQQNAMEAALWKKKNRKKLTNLLETFLEETVCLLNIDRSEFAVGALPWGFIFYNRMLSTKTLISAKRRALYEESFADYEEYFSECKPKEFKKKRAYITSVKTLVLYLKTHVVDPDNVLIGLSPSVSILERYQAWLAMPHDHQEQAESLGRAEGHSDPLSLYFLGYPGKKGDLILAQVPRDKIRKPTATTLPTPSAASSVVVYARIKEAVHAKNDTLLTVWIAPKEEQEIVLSAPACVPVRKLVPGTSWIGNAPQMREMVAELVDEVRSYLHRELIADLHATLAPLHAPVQPVYEGTLAPPVSFLYYHPLRDLAPLLTAFVQGQPHERYPDVARLHADYVRRAVAKTEAALQQLFREIDDPDGNSNKLFMVTSEQDIQHVRSLQPRQIVEDLLQSFAATVAQAVEMTESDKRELYNGNLKNQLSKWWVLLIDTRAQLLLAQTAYDASAWNEDTYIDGPPASLEGVRKNLEIVQQLLNPKHPANEVVVAATEDVKSEVYPVINDFLLKVHVMLSHDLLQQRVELTNYTPDAFDMPALTQAWAAQKEEMRARDPALFQQYDGLIKDLQYLVEMKTLEFQAAEDRKAAVEGKLALSYAVPLSGLMMGYFFRLENILKTVLELWAPKAQVSPASPGVAAGGSAPLSASLDVVSPGSTQGPGVVARSAGNSPTSTPAASARSPMLSPRTERHSEPAIFLASSSGGVGGEEDERSVSIELPDDYAANKRRKRSSRHKAREKEKRRSHAPTATTSPMRARRATVSEGGALLSPPGGEENEPTHKKSKSEGGKTRRKRRTKRTEESQDSPNVEDIANSILLGTSDVDDLLTQLGDERVVVERDAHEEDSNDEATWMDLDAVLKEASDIVGTSL